MRHVTLIVAIALSGCTLGPTWQSVRKDGAIFDTVSRQAYIDRRDLALSCLDHHGIFTQDGKACMVQKRGQCLFLTAPADSGHDKELTAICNGWRA
jgi:hypothetical protein